MKNRMKRIQTLLIIGLFTGVAGIHSAFAQTLTVERELPSVFTPGVPVSVSFTIHSTGISSGLGMTETFPEGWSFVSSTVNPNRQSGNEIEWFFPSAPQILILSYSVLPPLTDTGMKRFSGKLTYTQGDTFVHSDTKGDSLIPSFTQGAVEAFDSESSLISITGGMDYDDIDNREIFISWHYNGDFRIIDWHVYVRRGDGGYFYLAQTGDGSVRKYTWTDPDVNEQYQLKVIGIFKDEEGIEHYVILDQSAPFGYNLTGGTEVKLKRIANPDDLPVETAVVTDDLYHTVDLSGGSDVDLPMEQALALKWNPGSGDYNDFHISVSIDGENYSYLGHVGSGDLYYYRFDGDETFSSSRQWRSGPQPGMMYWFRIFALKEAGGLVIMETGPVGYAFDSGDIPTPIPTNTPMPQGPVHTPTPTPTPTFNPHTEVVSLPDLSEEVTPLELVLVPAGTFVMGSLESELDRENDESPTHSVTIGQDFYLGRYEVTNAQFVLFLNEKGLISEEGFERLQSDDADLTIFQDNGEWKSRPGMENHPAGEVSWYGARDYCDWLSELEPDLEFRLPTEAEWEYACRAETQTRFYWGDDLDYSIIANYAWYADNSDGTTHEVGEKIPNPWNLYDMNGNVWEWCADGYANYSSEDQTDPFNEAYRTVRMTRGGGYATQREKVRSAFRKNYSYPNQTWSYFGFRVAATRKY